MRATAPATSTRAVVLIAAAALLAGCIPQVDPPYRPAPRPPRTATPPDDRSPPPDEPYTDDTDARRGFDADIPPPPRVAPRPARPAWEVRPVAPEAAPIAETRYTVRDGDTLSRIAARTGAGAGAIARANDLPPDGLVRVGDRLTIPGGRYHLVRAGESGIAIARAYGIEWSRIVAANALAEPYILRAGERILIPGTPAGASSAAERARAFTLDIDDILTGGEPAQVADKPPARPVRTPSRTLPPNVVVAAPARLRGGFAWPVDGRIVRRFGPAASGQRNDGIDVAVPIATPVRASADGVVAYVGSGIAALGGIVIVKHGDGWVSVYGHTSKLLVQRGQSVRQGQTIALSGNSGLADRPELHFELRKGRAPVDPLGQLPRG